MPVTVPDVFTVATDRSALVHMPPAILLVNIMVLPVHISGEAGSIDPRVAVTVTMVAVLHPPGRV